MQPIAQAEQEAETAPYYEQAVQQDPTLFEEVKAVVQNADQEETVEQLKDANPRLGEELETLNAGLIATNEGDSNSLQALEAQEGPVRDIEDPVEDDPPQGHDPDH